MPRRSSADKESHQDGFGRTMDIAVLMVTGAHDRAPQLLKPYQAVQTQSLEDTLKQVEV